MHSTASSKQVGGFHLLIPILLAAVLLPSGCAGESRNIVFVVDPLFSELVLDDPIVQGDRILRSAARTAGIRLKITECPLPVELDGAGQFTAGGSCSVNSGAGRKDLPFVLLSPFFSAMKADGNTLILPESLNGWMQGIPDSHLILWETTPAEHSSGKFPGRYEEHVPDSGVVREIRPAAVLEHGMEAAWEEAGSDLARNAESAAFLYLKDNLLGSAYAEAFARGYSRGGGTVPEPVKLSAVASAAQIRSTLNQLKDSGVGHVVVYAGAKTHDILQAAVRLGMSLTADHIEHLSMMVPEQLSPGVGYYALRIDLEQTFLGLFGILKDYEGFERLGTIRIPARWESVPL